MQISTQTSKVMKIAHQKYPMKSAGVGPESIAQQIGHGLLRENNTPITHSRFATKILLRSDI